MQLRGYFLPYVCVVLGLRENKTENIGENITTKMAGIAWSGGCGGSERQSHRPSSGGMTQCDRSSEAAGHARATDAESDASPTGSEVPHSRSRILIAGLRSVERPQPTPRFDCHDDHAMFVIHCPTVGVPTAWHDSCYGSCHAYEDLNYGESGLARVGSQPDRPPGF